MVTLSSHAQRRCQQRGITLQMLHRVLENADTEIDVGDNCTLLRVSKQQARALRIDRISKVAVIWSERHAQIVTIMPVHESAGGRRYRAKN
jgi:hypothetical protein